MILDFEQSLPSGDSVPVRSQSTGEVTVLSLLLLLSRMSCEPGSVSFNKALSVRYGFSLSVVSRQFANKWFCFHMLRILIVHYLIKL